MKAAEHVIELKDPNATPFKERFRRIPPPQVDKVREHLKLMQSNRVTVPGVMLCCWFAKRMAP